MDVIIGVVVALTVWTLLYYILTSFHKRRTLYYQAEFRNIRRNIKQKKQRAREEEEA